MADFTGTYNDWVDDSTEDFDTLMWLPGSRSKPSDSAYSRVLFDRTATLFALVMSQEIFGCAGGRMYREGRKQKEIRVAIDGPSGAYDDDPEQAADNKPDKAHGQGKQQSCGACQRGPVLGAELHLVRARR